MPGYFVCIHHKVSLFFLCLFFSFFLDFSQLQLLYSLLWKCKYSNWGKIQNCEITSGSSPEGNVTVETCLSVFACFQLKRFKCFVLVFLSFTMPYIHTSTLCFLYPADQPIDCCGKIHRNVERQHVVSLIFHGSVWTGGFQFPLYSLLAGFETHACTNKHNLLEHAAIEKSGCHNPQSLVPHCRML